MFRNEINIPVTKSDTGKNYTLDIDRCCNNAINSQVRLPDEISL